MPEGTGARAARVRRFNRFYTREIGVLDEHLLQSDYSLTEARVLYELAHRKQATASDLVRELNLNAGYLSRIIGAFEKRGLLTKTPSGTDARAAHLALTTAGRAAYKPLDRTSQGQVIAMLEKLSPVEQCQLVDAMNEVESLLSTPRPGFVLREPEPGDMGWVVHRQAVLYAQEYGWDATFEALVAEIVAAFVRDFKPSLERCWIAEKDGKVVGSVFAVQHDDETAKLRLLYVEPSARGLGIGRRLVDECIAFARRAGYREMMLWTNSVLVAARRIYEAAGFALAAEQPHHSFGKDLVGQTWERPL